MLKIHNLGRGQQEYYLSRIARNAEDYYLGHGEAPGRWIGGSATALGLDGEVDGDHFRSLLTGHAPDGAKLGRQVDVPGYDFLFAAPKSVSVLWALGGEEMSTRVRDAHDKGVDAAMGYLGEVASYGRRGAGGTRRIETAGFAAAAFRHRTSRLGDPHLHTHVVVSNKVLGIDGKWSALHATLGYHQAKTAGQIYQATIRRELADLGLSWELHDNGTCDCACVPQGVRDEFSQRRRQILAEAEAVGATTPEQVTIVQRRTRPAKLGTYEEGIALAAEWETRAAALGFGREQIAAEVDRGLEVDVDARENEELDAAARALLGPLGLTEHASTFAERDVIGELAGRVRNGASVDAVRETAVRLLSNQEVVAAGTSDPGIRRGWARMRGAPRWTPVGAGEARFTTRDLLRVERELLDLAEAGQTAAVGAVDEGILAAALAAYPQVASSDEQHAMVRTLATSGRGVEVVTAPAGAGKTTAMGAATAAWQAQGHHVLGATLSAKAKGILADETGMQTETVAGLKMWLRREDYHLPEGTVLVVDEAGQVGSRDLHLMASAVRKARGKLVLVGDPRQLPEIDAGGMFKALLERLPQIRLRANRRQVDEDERRRLLLLRAGKARTVAAAMRSYDRAGRVTRGATAEDVRRLLVVDWANEWLPQDTPGRESRIMLALTNADAADLNERARVVLSEAGVLEGAELHSHGRVFQAGDHIVSRLNEYRKVDVLNGQRWVVQAVDASEGTLTVAELKRGRLGQAKTLPAWYLEHVQHAYAVTVSISQGSTVDRAWVLGSEATYREAGYVAASRARERTQWYLTEASQAVEVCCEHGPGCHGDHEVAQEKLLDVAGRDPMDAQIAALTRSRWEPSAGETVQPEPVLEQLTGQKRGVQMDAAQIRSEIAAIRQVLTRRGPIPPDVSRTLEQVRAELTRARVRASEAFQSAEAAGEALAAVQQTRTGLRRRPDPRDLAHAQHRASVTTEQAEQWANRAELLAERVAGLEAQAEVYAGWAQQNRTRVDRLDYLTEQLGPAEAAERRQAERSREPYAPTLDL